MELRPEHGLLLALEMGEGPRPRDTAETSTRGHVLPQSLWRQWLSADTLVEPRLDF